MKKLFALVLLGVFVVLFFSGCGNNNRTSEIVRATGPMTIQNFNVEGFTGLNIAGFWNVSFRQSENHLVTIETAENLFEFINVTVRQGTLYPMFDVGIGIEFGEYIPSITIYAPFLTDFEMSGSITATDWDIIYVQNLSMKISGFGNIDIAINVEQLNMDISGSNNITLSGTADIADITQSGFGTISAFELQTRSAILQTSGSVNADITVSEYLNVTSSGFSNIRYRGNPTVTQSIMGQSTISRDE